MLWYQKKAERLHEEVKAEFPATHEEAFERTLRGAIFGAQMRVVRDEGRIGKVPYQLGKPVHVAFDLGHNDTTALWFFQNVDAATHVLSYYEHRLVTIDHYIDRLEQYRRKRGYRYGTLYLPHDGEQRASIRFRGPRRKFFAPPVTRCGSSPRPKPRSMRSGWPARSSARAGSTPSTASTAWIAWTTMFGPLTRCTRPPRDAAAQHGVERCRCVSDACRSQEQRTGVHTEDAHAPHGTHQQAERIAPPSRVVIGEAAWRR